MSASILYRNLINGDPAWGGGTSNFVADIDAVAQACSTRLKLNVGEFWASLNSGIPMFQAAASGTPNTQYILGSPNGQAIAASLIGSQILGTPFVSGLSQVTTAFDNKTRTLLYAAIVLTPFGPIAIVYAPGLNASLTFPNQSISVINTLTGYGAGGYAGAGFGQ